MAELEKVIAGLECCILKDPDDKHRCDVCPYNPSNYDEISNSPCVNGLKAKALDLLKAQVPRVMTLYVMDAISALAHELAHVAVGYEAGHDESWEAAYEAIRVEYDRIGDEMFEMEDNDGE